MSKMDSPLPKTIGPTRTTSDESMSFEELVNSFNDDVSEMLKKLDDETAAHQLKEGLDAYEQTVEDQCKFWQEYRKEQAKLAARIEEEEKEWKKLKGSFAELCVTAVCAMSTLQAFATRSSRRLPKLGFGPRRTRGRQ